ncbi:PEP-CTERM sorting domain-containing protein [Aeoliella sp. ICT_H6.2]|uniref:PEP-CTERM sorting domain-containing protein n=1 Tax=Aeoliella straminimaris TaxID=2954799 RepID=A0A9X2FG38_9BACT|nr:PEP-CTERM sorting domain-containing protein [Aeoliella straminimaris]MCO6045066.1 PEP-CTERM sorting domain-containing protein [Aeoliella straminimaris]
MRLYVMASFLSVLTTPLAATGALTVYEGFSEYADGDAILNVSGGTGFVNTWQPGNTLLGGAGVPSSDSVQLVPSSLAYTDTDGSRLQTAGGSLFLTGQYGSTKIARTYDQSALPHPAPPQLGESTYISFLARRSGAAADPNDPIYGGNYPWGDNLYPRVAGVNMYSNDNGDQVPLLIGNLSNVDQDVWRLSGQDLDDQSNAPIIDQPFGEGSNTYLVVFRIDHAAGDGDGDQIHMYLDPLLESEGQNTPSLVANWEKDDDPLYLPGDWLAVQVGDDSGNRPYSEFTFDEYRIGSTWEDVTPFTAIPEPTSLMLLGLSGLAVVVCHRRN